MSERSLFIRALEIDDPAQRAELLTRECGDDAELRHRIEKLLYAHTAAGGILDKPPVNPPATDLFRPITEGPGTVIGPYKLLQQIGEGGFGVVYMAEQQRPVRRKVALKIIKPGMDTREVIARFESERQALALMDHPNIARVLDAGATDSGRPYFVMELVKGVPITDYCDKNTLPTEKRLELFITVCHAVQHAHQKGVIHRDIKPSNVMVTLHDGHPVPKVIDFGVSKATSQQLTERTLFTAYGQMIGTPAYMSPEQAEMSGLDIDTRSDLYSLGVLLYELLTGTTPFDGKRLREAGYLEMQRIIREEAPPRPSTRVSTLGEALTVLSSQRSTDPKKLGQQLRGDLDVIVMKSLEKERGRRYDTPNAFADDIRRFLNHEAIVARPASTAYRLKKFVQRNVAAVAAVSAIAAALLIGTLISAIAARNALYNRRLAEDSLRVALADRQQAEQAQKNTVAALETAERERDRAEKAKAEESKQRQLALEQKQAAEAAEKAAATERTAALQERDKATAASAELAKQKEQQRRLLYVAQMNLIQKAWNDDNVTRVQELLNATRPRPGEADLRSIEWHYWQRMLHQEERSLRLPVRLPASTRGFGRVSAGVSGQLTASSAFISSDGTRLATIVTDDSSREPADVLKVWDTASCAAEPIYSHTLPRLPASSERAGPALGFEPRSTARYTIAFLDSQRVVLARSNSPSRILAPADAERLRNASTEERRALLEELNRQRQASAATVLQTFDLTAPPHAPSQAPTAYSIGSQYVFSTDGSRLATWNPVAPASEAPSDTISILDARTGATLDQLPSPFSRLTLCAISNDGQRLAIAEVTSSGFGGPGGPAPQSDRQLIILHRDSRDSVTLQPQSTSDNLPRINLRAKWEFSADSAQLVVSASPSVSSPAGWMLFDATSGRELPISTGTHPLMGTLRRVPTSSLANNILAYSPNGKWLAANTGDRDERKLAIWETATGQPGPEIKGHAAAPVLTAFSADSARLITADESGVIKVWNLASSLAPALPSGDDPRAQFLSYLSSPWNIPSPDGRWTAVAPRVVRPGFGSPEVKLEPPFELKLTDKSGRVPARVLALPGPVHSLAFSSDGSLLASVAIDLVAKLEEAVELRIWNVATGEPLQASIPRFRASESRFGSSRGGFGPAAADSKNSSNRQITTIRNYNGARPAFSPDGRYLAVGGRRIVPEVPPRAIHLYLLDVTQRLEIPVALRPRPEGATSDDLLQFSPDSRMLLAITTHMSPRGTGFGPPQASGQSCQIFAAATGEFLWQASSILNNSVAISADSQRVAAISIPSAESGNSRESAVVIWEAGTGQELARIELPANRVFTSLAISPTGDRVAVQSPSGVTIYDMATNRELYSLERVSGQIKFTSDGLRLATTAPTASLFSRGLPSSFESTRTTQTEAKVWDAITGQELLSFSTDSPLYTEFQARGVTTGFAPLPPQVEAESIVEWLSATDADGHFLSRGQIAERIKTDPSLTDATRAIALQLAAQRRRSVWSLANPAVEILHTTGLPREKYQQALEWLAEAIEQSPAEGILFSRRGLAHYRLGDYPAALASLEQSLKLRSAANHPPLPDTLVFLAMTHHQLGHADQARQFFYQTEREYQAGALRLNASSSLRPTSARGGAPAGDADSFSSTAPSDFDSLTEAAALLGLKKSTDHIIEGNALRDKRAHDQAIAQYDAAIALDPENPEAYVQRAITCRIKSDFDKMIADASIAIRLDPKLAVAYNLRGIAWNTKREHAKAIEDFTEAIKLEPRSGTYLGNRGNALFRNREYDRAIADLTAALNTNSTNNPNNASAYTFRGLAFEGKREFARALADFDAAIRLNTTDPATYAGRARMHHKLGNRDQALADFQTAIDRSPGPAAATFYRDRGNMWVAEKQFELAIKDFSDCVRLDPNHVAGYTNRGISWMRLGELEKALTDYEEALHREPNGTVHLNNRGAVLTLLGRYTEALADLNKGIQREPRVAAFRFWRGFLFAKQGQHDQAQQEQAEFLKLSPTPADGLRDRSERWLNWGEYANAIADYERLLILEPNNIRERTSFAWLLATCPDDKIRDGKKALELATRAVELTDSKLHSVLDTLAAAHAELDNFPEAITWAEKALALAPTHEKPPIESRLTLYGKNKPYRESPTFAKPSTTTVSPAKEG